MQHMCTRTTDGFDGVSSSPEERRVRGHDCVKMTLQQDQLVSEESCHHIKASTLNGAGGVDE